MDLGAQLVAAMTAWFDAVAAALLGPALSAVAQLLFQTPAFDRMPAVMQTWEVVRSVADALFVLAWLAVGILVMVHGGAQARYTAKVLVPRVALAAILANASLAICGALIQFDNALVVGLIGPRGADLFGAFASALGSPAPTNLVVAALVGIVAAVLALLLVVLCIGRLLLLLLVIALGPIALATYALPQTSELAHLWWRVLAALLFVQVVQALLVTVAATVLVHIDWLGGVASDLVPALLALSVLYLLFRLPFATYEWAIRRPVHDSHVFRSVVLGARAMAVL